MKTGSQGKRIECKNNEIQGFVIFSSTTHNNEEKNPQHPAHSLVSTGYFHYRTEATNSIFVIGRGVHELRMKRSFVLNLLHNFDSLYTLSP